MLTGRNCPGSNPAPRPPQRPNTEPCNIARGKIGNNPSVRSGARSGKNGRSSTSIRSQSRYHFGECCASLRHALIYAFMIIDNPPGNSDAQRARNTIAQSIRHLSENGRAWIREGSSGRTIGIAEGFQRHPGALRDHFMKGERQVCSTPVRLSGAIRTQN